MCRQHEAMFNKALTGFLQFPVSKPPTVFPGALTYIEWVHQAGETDTFKFTNSVKRNRCMFFTVHSFNCSTLKTRENEIKWIFIIWLYHMLLQFTKACIPTNLTCIFSIMTRVMPCLTKPMWSYGSQILPSVILETIRGMFNFLIQ